MDYEQGQGKWILNGWVADNRLNTRESYETDASVLSRIPPANRIFFNSAMEAGAAGYPPNKKPTSDQYACQGIGGGGEPLPDFP